MGNKVEKITEAINYGVTALMPGPHEPTEAELKAAEERKRLRERRSHIAQEILTTEKNYVNTLNDLFNKWELPLRKALEIKPIIAREEIKLIFSNSEVLMGFHQMLLASLEEKISNWSDATEIGLIFLEKAPVLKLYVEYVNNYDNSVRTIAECTKNKSFVDFLMETVGMVDTYPLSSLLIQPIQRIPRYEMLLTDLVKHTWDAHPDMESLQNALALIKANAQFVNAQKKRFEDSQKLLDIQTKVGINELFAPHRSVLLDNDLLLSKNTRPPIPIKCCLLNDSILIWEETEKSLFNLRQGKVHLFEELINIVMQDVSPDCVTFIVDKDEYGIYFPPESKMNKETWMKEYNSATDLILKNKAVPLTEDKPKQKEKDKKSDKEKDIYKEKKSEREKENFKEKDKENKEKKSSEKEILKEKDNKEKKDTKPFLFSFDDKSPKSDTKEENKDKEKKGGDKQLTDRKNLEKSQKKGIERVKSDFTHSKKRSGNEKSEKRGLNREKSEKKEGGSDILLNFNKLIPAASTKEKKTETPTPKEEPKSPIDKIKSIPLSLRQSKAASPSAEKEKKESKEKHSAPLSPRKEKEKK